MNSRGIQLSGGFGKEMSNLIVDGVTSIDMSGYNISRFHPSYIDSEKWLDETIHESIVSCFDIRLLINTLCIYFLYNSYKYVLFVYSFVDSLGHMPQNLQPYSL